SAAAMDRSSGVVMKPRTRSALAPTYAVCTVTVALSSLGYCRTFNDRTACSPAMMITRFTTMASTGRRMKMSVSFITSPVFCAGRELGLLANAVVDLQRQAVAELERPSRHHLRARGEAVEDRGAAAAGAPRLDELLARLGPRLAVRSRLFLHDEHRISERGVHDRRDRDRDDLLALGQHDLHPQKHAGTQRVGPFGQAGAHLDVARLGVEGGLDGADGAFGERRAPAFFVGAHHHPELHLIEVPLRQAEIDEGRLRRLERGALRAGREVLSEVDLADAELAAERRPDHLAGDLGFDGGNVSAQALVRRLVVVELGLRDDALSGERARARQLGLRQLLAGPQRRELRTLDLGVEL